MRPQNRAAVLAVQLFKPTETPMDVHIVNEKIREAVKGNPNANEQDPKIRRQTPNHVTNHTRNGKNQEKTVVFFKKTFLFVLGQVVVFVPFPQETVHHVFVREPGHEFHADIGGKGDERIKQPVGHV